MKHFSLFSLLLLVAGCSNALQDQIPGTYEYHDAFFDLENTFRSNGRVDMYDQNGLMEENLQTWKVVDDEMFIIFPDGDNQVWRREPNGDIRLIAWVTKGKREELLSLQEQRLWTRKPGWIPYRGAGAAVLALLALVLWRRRSRA